MSFSIHLYTGKTDKCRNENNDPKGGVNGIAHLSGYLIKASSMCPEEMN
jgi:hypothetical protein